MPDVKEKDGAVTLPQVKGEVTFDNVSFAYDKEHPALTDFNLEVRPGEVVALVGPSGAGKSTVANLLPRFYDVTAGRLLIDGIDVRDVTFASLRQQIGLVPQETMLFNAKCSGNILYGRSTRRKKKSSRPPSCQCPRIIMRLPGGYDALVGDRGNSLSGGQRQRIAIARAILKNPRILILDEATSALDTESEKIVQAALDRLMEGRTPSSSPIV